MSKPDTIEINVFEYIMHIALGFVLGAKTMMVLMLVMK
jgi:hypothetical protein